MASGNIAFSGLRGKVGNFVFSKWKGIETARGYNPNPANPRTDAQLSARSRITMLVAQYRANARFLSSMYAYKAVKQSAYNAFISAQNVRDLIDFDPNGIALNITFAGLRVQNQYIVIGSATADNLDTTVIYTFAQLLPSRNYTIDAIVQDSAFATISANATDTFLTNLTGEATVSLIFPSSVVAAIGTIVLVTDTLSGVKYAYYIAL